MTQPFLKWVFLLVTIFFGVGVLAQEEGLSFRQKVLMPGLLIEGHADLETQCEKCHSSFEKDQLTPLCLDCHEEIALDREEDVRFHGKMGPQSTDDCQNCHKEHEGRDADITGLNPDTFDHSATEFPLEGAHEAQTCDACHDGVDEENKPIKYRDTLSECIDCHESDDIHKGEAGNECDACHEPVSWQKLQEFDHSTTDFELKGKHEDVSCNSCHIAQQFTFDVTTCVSCHLASDVHAGANGDTCDDCHSERGWDEVEFNHDETEFPLVGSHNEVPCHACHEPGDQANEAPTTCYGCHANQDLHLGRNGKQCDSCHKPEKWKDINFNHDIDTDYPLTGEHKDVTCTQCHVGALDDPLPRDCASCHKIDDPHNNPEMQVCALCHSTEGWKAINLFDHDFAALPLIGMHRIVPCQSCHISNEFVEIGTQCDICHKADDVHKGTMSGECDECHTPNAWNPWQFDHRVDTDYPLEGKHQKVACEACHKEGVKREDTPKVCGTCHQRQDIHGGEFGDNCGRCHSNSGFFELFLP